MSVIDTLLDGLHDVSNGLLNRQGDLQLTTPLVSQALSEAAKAVIKLREDVGIAYDKSLLDGTCEMSKAVNVFRLLSGQEKIDLSYKGLTRGENDKPLMDRNWPLYLRQLLEAIHIYHWTNPTPCKMPMGPMSVELIKGQLIITEETGYEITTRTLFEARIVLPLTAARNMVPRDATITYTPSDEVVVIRDGMIGENWMTHILERFAKELHLSFHEPVSEKEITDLHNSIVESTGDTSVSNYNLGFTRTYYEGSELGEGGEEMRVRVELSRYVINHETNDGTTKLNVYVHAKYGTPLGGFDSHTKQWINLPAWLQRNILEHLDTVGRLEITQRVGTAEEGTAQ
jgi:hypothetical protein